MDGSAAQRIPGSQWVESPPELSPQCRSPKSCRNSWAAPATLGPHMGGCVGYRAGASGGSISTASATAFVGDLSRNPMDETL
jgi:hypothetical protein